MSIEPSRFSQRTKSLIKKVDNVVTKYTQLLPQLYESLREDGLSHFEARDYIKEIIDVSDRHLRRILPDTDQPQLSKADNMAGDKQTAITKDKIPPPPQPIVDIEPEPPKVLSHPEVIEIVRAKQDQIESNDRKIKLDTAKFRSELRIALINGDKVWLRYNSSNEVIKISEQTRS